MTKRMLAVVVAIAVIGSMACSKKDKDPGQSKRTPAKIEKTRSGQRGSPEARALRLQKRLDLSEEQRAAVEAILRDHPGPERSQAEAALKALLEPEQLAKYEAMMSGRGRRPRANDPAARAAHMKTELGLDDEQTRKLEKIYQARGSRSEQRDEIKLILTSEQLAKYEELGARRDPRGLRRRGFSAPVERAAWLHKELGLDDAQKDKLATLFQTPHTRAQTLAAVKEILTAEQLAEYEDMRANRSELRPKHGFKAPAERAAWLHKELGLDDAQRDQLEKMFKIVKSREEVGERLGMILSKEQLARYDVMTASRRRVRDLRPTREPAPAAASPGQP